MTDHALTGAMVPLDCAGCGTAGEQGDRFCEICGARRPDPRDRVEIVLPALAGISDRGLRHLHNEDALALRTVTRAGRDPVRIAVVCDGVSSAPRPDLASLAAADTAVATLADLLDGDGEDAAVALDAAARSAAAAVVDVQETAQLPRASACTFVAAAVVDGTVTIAWVGDSRAYWLPAGEEPGCLLTLDDSWIVHTVLAGGMTAERAARDPRAHAITAWLGADATSLEVHLTALRPRAPGTLVLCTDGLWNDHPSPTSLAAALTTDPAADPLGAARELVSAALARGGRDNITVAVIPITGTSSDTDGGAP
jgi:serine/threonine protein phosphatase PrpC